MKKLIYCLLMFILIGSLAGSAAVKQKSNAAKEKQAKKAVKKRPTKSIVVTAENKKSLSDQILFLKGIKDINKKEADLFYNYIIAADIDAYHSKQPPRYLGKTVGQIIDEERKIEEEQ